MYLFLVLRDFLELTLQNHGDGEINSRGWRKEHQGIAIEITPANAGRRYRMNLSDSFCGLELVIYQMNSVSPIHWPRQVPGFWENRYQVSRGQQHPLRTIGVIQLSLVRSDAGRLTTSKHSDDLMASNSTDMPSEINSTTLDDLPIPQGTSNSSAVLSALPNPFNVPDTDVTLLFGRPSTNPPTKQRILLLLVNLFQLLYENIVIHGVDVPFSGCRFDSPESSLELESRMQGGTPLLSVRTAADAITGIVFYMLKEGFVATDITIIKPNESGRRSAVGTLSIGRNREPAPSETIEAGPRSDVNVSSS